VDDVREAARIAAGYMDIVTTSGPATGQAAAPDKIRAMKEALGTFPLAIASGITAQNIGNYLNTADCFLVATGISSSRSELNEELVKGLIDEIWAFR
jgi:predicted TIM-barrel enzyme